MKAGSTTRLGRSEKGIALLISIFILLLISVVAIALVVSSGTESALAGNYRSATGVYYAALAGLEEARGRLLSKNPDSFKTTAPGFLPSPGTPLAIGSVAYVLNPDPTEAAPALLTAYPDTEYDNEFGSGSLASATVTTTNSVWNKSPLNALNIPGPMYKWVRINAVSEQSLHLDTYPYEGSIDPTPVYYDGTHLNDINSGSQVLEITALAVLPNGSQKLLQYLAAPVPITLPPFLAALTLAGSVASSVVAYSAPPADAGFEVLGLDQDCNGNPTGLKFPAIGVFNNADADPAGPVISGIPPGTIRNNNYPGVLASPDVEVIYSSFPPTMTTPGGLDAIAQTIIQNRDGIIPSGSASTQRDYLRSLVSSGAMSPSSPMTLVANGDLDLTVCNCTGYGLLLVTGNLNYDPDSSWNGIILVIGQGTVTGSHRGSGEFNGALLVARTRDSSGNLLPDPYLGNSFVNFNLGTPMGGEGIRYSSCWVQASMPVLPYKVLSFHEISQ